MALRAQHPVWSEFADGWNALAYRFLAMIEAGDAFAQSLSAHGAFPPPKERYEQETALSNFYDKGFEAFESGFYALHALGAMVNGSPLSMATPKDKQSVNPSNVRSALTRAFAGDPTIAVITAILDDLDYKSFRETRAILSHRSAPGRTMFVGIPTADELPTEWKLNKLPLDERIATGGRATVSRILAHLVGTCDDFSKRLL
jgi:hypothetical protein